MIVDVVSKVHAATGSSGFNAPRWRRREKEFNTADIIFDRWFWKLRIVKMQNPNLNRLGDYKNGWNLPASAVLSSQIVAGASPITRCGRDRRRSMARTKGCGQSLSAMAEGEAAAASPVTPYPRPWPSSSTPTGLVHVSTECCHSSHLFYRLVPVVQKKSPVLISTSH